MSDGVEAVTATLASGQAVLADSVTQLDGQARGRVAVCGSHGGRYSAACAVAAGVAGIVLNDAAIGRDRAGVDGLVLLDDHGVPGATVDRMHSVIGSASETARGTISHVNAAARALGVEAGDTALHFAECVMAAPAGSLDGFDAPQVQESRSLLLRGRTPVWALDSASLAQPQDAGAVVITGSHAQLVGGRVASALRVDARAAIFNDAGGVVAPSRLEALDERGIAAVAVAAFTARIGDARSTYFDGVISFVNATAAAHGATVSTTAKAFVQSVIERTNKEGPR